VNELYRYLTLAVSPEWRRLDETQRAADKRELAAVADGMGVRVHAYSLAGTRADADLLLWAVADDLEALRAFEVRLAGTRLWAWSTRPYAYLAARRRSQYLGEHRHDGGEHAAPAGPVGDKSYVVVYPMTKKRTWYALPAEERTRIMAAHFVSIPDTASASTTTSSSSRSNATTCASSSRSSRICARRNRPRTPSARLPSSSGVR